MKEKFEDRSFSGLELELIKVSNDIIERYAQQGYDLSLRQLFYQLVTINALPNEVRSYELLGRVITGARMAGLVDWSMIVDRGRTTMSTKKFSTPGRAIKNLAASFRLNRWINQPCHIEVMVEKQALQGVLAPVCSKWAINFTSNKGYSSASLLYSTAKRLKKKIDAKKEVVVLYLGDHDPSGVDMTRDLRDRLSTFAGANIDVKRLALNMSQVEDLRLPPNPAKLSDSRATIYVAKYGTSSWELDALSPPALEAIVSNAVKRRLDLEAWARDGEKEKLAVKLIKRASKSIDAAFKGPTTQDSLSPLEEPPTPVCTLEDEDGPELSRGSSDDSFDPAI